jgi:hypothetical protein
MYIFFMFTTLLSMYLLGFEYHVVFVVSRHLFRWSLQAWSFSFGLIRSINLQAREMMKIFVVDDH